MGTTTSRHTVESEIRTALVHYLPVGMEGVAAAQAQAAMGVLARRGAGPYAVFNEAQALAGRRLLRQEALRHRASHNEATGDGVCTRCPTEEAGSAWPCPVWSAAALLGLVRG